MESEDGLYKVNFNTPLGAGAGVVVLRDGKIQGGDSSIAYLGSYNLNNGYFSGSVKTKRHSNGLPSVFGVDEVEIRIEGEMKGGRATLKGSSPQRPGVGFQATIERIAA